MVPQKKNDLAAATLPPVWLKDLLPTLQGATTPAALEAFSARLPHSITEALPEPPASAIVRLMGPNSVKRWLEFELIKANELLGGYGGLNDSQVQFIAQQFLESFHTESLADFKLCLKLGCAGEFNRDKFNRLKWFDPPEWRRWFDAYLERKYQAIEADLMRGPDSLYRNNVNDDLAKTKAIPAQRFEYNDDVAQNAIAEIKAIIEATPRPGRLQKIPDLSAAEIRREGQERPAPREKYKPAYTTWEQLQNRELHFKWMAEVFDRYGRPLPNYVDEQTYIRQYHEKNKAYRNTRRVRVTFVSRRHDT